MNHYEITKKYIDIYSKTIHNVHKELLKNEIDTYNWIVNKTSFLPNDCKFSERLYLINNGIYERPYNKYKKKYLNFVNFYKGYNGFTLPDTR